MDALARLLTGGLFAASTPEPTADFWYRPIGYGAMTVAGQRVDPEGAKKISAWFRGRDLLATSLAMLPLNLYERLPDDGGAEIMRAHPLHDCLHRKPNVSDDSFVWRWQAMFDLIDHGHHYDWLTIGQKWALDRIDPTLVTPERLANGRTVFHVRDSKTGQTTTHTQDDVFHLQRAEGKGILESARDSLGLTLATERYAGSIFGHGSLRAGSIKVPGSMDEDSAKAMASSFVTAAGEWHMPRVLPNGADYIPDTGMTPEDAQMLLSRKFSVNDIARWLGLPPHMLGDLDRATFSNIEHQGQEFVTYSLGPWLSLWEFAINDQLVLQPNRFYVEFVRDALVRGDIKTRWEAHVAAVNAGIKSVDEVRRVENLNKRGGKADELREPQNITGKPTVAGSDPEPDEDEPEDEQQESARATAIVQQSAARLLRKEIQAVQKLAVRYAADGDAFAAAVTEFYAKHAELVAVTLQMSDREASGYCAGQAAQIVSGNWIAAVEQWGSDAYAAGVAAIALEGEAA